MIVCSCRWISTRDYRCKRQLAQRIMEDDVICGVCQTEAVQEEAARTPQPPHKRKKKRNEN